MPKPIKLEKVAELKKQLEESNSVFVTEYTGLNVADLTLLRKKLRENSAKFFVAKNTLIRIAAKETGFDGILDHLQGQTAITFANEDPAIAAKILYDSFKEIEKPVIKAFVVEKETFAGSEIKRLAELPSREVLLSQIVSSVEAPIANVISSVDAVFHELIATVDALAKSKE